MQKQRFVTFLREGSDDVECLTHEEFLSKKQSQDQIVAGEDWDEWVWQFALTKEEAISQHFEKMDLWHKDPTRETY